MNILFSNQLISIVMFFVKGNLVKTSTTRSHEAACVPPATSYRLLNPKWPTEGPKMADGVWVANKIGYARTHSLTHSPTPLLESLGGWVGCQL